MSERIFNEDIRVGLFHITINEAWIHTASSESYSDEYDFDFEETDEMKWEIFELLNQLCNEVETAINRCRYDWIEDLINNCITSYANIFPPINQSDNESEDMVILDSENELQTYQVYEVDSDSDLDLDEILI